MAFERGMRRILQCCDKVKEFAYVACMELLICIVLPRFLEGSNSGVIMESLCNGRTRRIAVPARSWPTERAGGPLAWFYIPRPFRQAIAEGFQDCTRIARGLRIVLDF